MAQVILAYEKHGEAIYGSALRLLQTRVDEGYWYNEEETRLAKLVLAVEDEDKAWVFLARRRDYEYENVARMEVL